MAESLSSASNGVKEQQVEELKKLNEILEKETNKYNDYSNQIMTQKTKYEKEKEKIEIQIKNLTYQAQDLGYDVTNMDDKNQQNVEIENNEIEIATMEKKLHLETNKTNELQKVVQEKQMKWDHLNIELENGISSERREVEKNLEKFSKLLHLANMKNEHMTDKLTRMELRLLKLMKESRQARNILLKKIVGEHVEEEKYSNVCIAELTRLYLQVNNFSMALNQQSMGLSAGASIRIAGARHVITGKKKFTEVMEEETRERGKANGRNLLLQYNEMKLTNAELLKIFDSLELDLLESRKAHKDCQKHRHKLNYWFDKQRIEKDNTVKVEQSVEIFDKKVVCLSDHIEKLMSHLKHEAQNKNKEYETQRRIQKEVDLLRSRNETIAKKNNGKDRVIAEMKEGSRILEDQLRLMDEKYLELRCKLDFTREKSKQEVKKFEKKCKTLRKDWEKTKPQFPLDSIPLPIEIAESIKTETIMNIKSNNRKADKSSIRNNTMQNSMRSESSNHMNKTGTGPLDMDLTVTINQDETMDDELLDHTIEEDEPWSDAKIKDLNANLEKKGLTGY